MSTQNERTSLSFALPAKYCYYSEVRHMGHKILNLSQPQHILTARRPTSFSLASSEPYFLNVYF